MMFRRYTKISDVVKQIVIPYCNTNKKKICSIPIMEQKYLFNDSDYCDEYIKIISNEIKNNSYKLESKLVSTETGNPNDFIKKI
jgi:hypothetical protein